MPEAVQRGAEPKIVVMATGQTQIIVRSAQVVVFQLQLVEADFGVAAKRRLDALGQRQKVVGVGTQDAVDAADASSCWRPTSRMLSSIENRPCA